MDINETGEISKDLVNHEVPQYNHDVESPDEKAARYYTGLAAFLFVVMLCIIGYLTYRRMCLRPWVLNLSENSFNYENSFNSFT